MKRYVIELDESGRVTAHAENGLTPIETMGLLHVAEALLRLTYMQNSSLNPASTDAAQSAEGGARE